jgi:hypothetical protein
MITRRIIIPTLLVTMIFARAALLRAQLNRGIVEGIVTDPQGAVVPRVKVRVTNVGTGIVSVTQTNRTGYYRVVDLTPGTYRADFTAAGFTPVEVVAIQVLGGRSIKVDATLNLGATRQLVQVTAARPLVETGASNFSTTLGASAVQNIPVQGRDIQQLTFLFPGVRNAAGPPGSNFGFNSEFGTFPDPTHVQGSDLSVNGGQGGANAWYLDGMYNVSEVAENIAVDPSPDAVAEFQAVTNGFSAQYSRTGGGVFEETLKSGTNKVHGDLYEYIRNSAFNARNPFTSINAVGQLIPQDVLRYNDFGGTWGGPAVIPHIYNGRDKTFFFVSIEHQTLDLSGSQVFSVPTVLMRQGNFSEDPSTVENGMWMPASTVGPNSSGLFQRTAFGTPVPSNPYGASGCLNTSVEAAGGTGAKTCNFSAQIPQSMLDPTAMFFVKSFPLPNYNDPLSNCPMGASGYKICDNYLGTVSSSQDPYTVSIKVDHQWSNKSTYFAEWVFNPGTYTNYRLPWTGATLPTDVGFGADLPFDFENQVAGFGNTYTFSPTLINEFHASYNRQYISTNPETGGYPESDTDLAQVTQVLAPSKIFLSQYTPSPSFTVPMPGGGAAASFGTPGWINEMQATESYTILDDVTKVLGNHTLKFGFSYELNHEGRHISDPTSLDFSGTLTADPNTGLGGSGLEQFELGSVSSDTNGESETGVTPMAYASFTDGGAYVQDDYRVTRRLTLNLGLRWDYSGFWHSRYGPESNFCLSCMNSYTGLPGKMIYSGQSGFPSGSPIAPAHLRDFGPRFNFAWAPFANQKTVLRGGYDIFYTNATNSFNNIGQGDIPGPDWQPYYVWDGSFYPNQCAAFSNECVAFPLSNTTTVKGDLTNPPTTSGSPAASLSPGYNTNLQMYAPTSHDPMEQMWSFNIQRHLPGDMMLEVGYVGSHGTNLAAETFRNFNYVHTSTELKYKQQINADVPITSVYSGQTATALEQIYGSSELPLSKLLVPYPAFGSIYPQTVFDAMSEYDGLNVKVDKHFSYGLNFLAAYTWSKEIDLDTSQLASELFNTVSLSKAGNIGGRAGVQGGAAASGVSGVFGGGYQNPDDRNEDRAIAIDDIPQNFNLAVTYELPFGKGRAFLSNQPRIVNAVLGGWRLTGNFNAESGTPLEITGPCDQITCRPDLVGNPRAVPGGQNVNDWINAAAFTPPFGNNQSFWNNYNPSAPNAWLFGTAGLRLPGLRGPGFLNLDSALAKDFHLSESSYFELRWEAFNALNHMNPGLPDTNYCLPPGPNGQVNSVQQEGCEFGRITNIQTDPRAMQFALKFYW